MYKAWFGFVIALGIFGNASAQVLPPGGGSFVGRAPDRPGCPAIEVHIVRNNTTLTGVAFYSNGSGVSSVKGNTDGRTVSWSLEPIKGNGPTGQVTGTISPEGLMKTHLAGTQCNAEATLGLYHDYGGGTN